MSVAGQGDVTATSTGFRHEAMFWRTEEELLAGTVPFLREGLEAGEPALVAVTTGHWSLIADALGPDADAVRFADMTLLGANPACIIPLLLGFAEESGGRPCRGVGEPVWPGRRGAEIEECALHEAQLNLALGPGTPLRLRCPYDVKGLTPEVLAQAERSHEVVLLPGERWDRTAPYDGTSLAMRWFAAELPEPQVPVQSTRFDGGDLRRVRRIAGAAARAVGVSDEHVADLELAVYELAANSVQHGGGGGELRLWREPDALVCEVRDTGHVSDPLVGRRPGTTQDASGRGLWMVNRLCDLVQVRSTPAGTTVRVRTWV